MASGYWEGFGDSGGVFRDSKLRYCSKRDKVQQNFNANIQSRNPPTFHFRPHCPYHLYYTLWKSETNAPPTMLERAMCEDRGCEGGVLGILEVGGGGK